MKHDAHVRSWYVHLAKLSLGTRYVLHRQHSGGVSHNPASVNVLKTVKRVNREAKAEAALPPKGNVRALPRR